MNNDIFLKRKTLYYLDDAYHNKSIQDNRVSTNCLLIKHPFKVVIVDKIFKDIQYIGDLKNAVEDLCLIEKNNDLYSLHQSVDLKESKDFSIQRFIKFLREKVMPQLEKLLGYSLLDHISITGSMYEEGDYLLCHDDKLDDRAIAFVYYLCDLHPDYGGEFGMFNHCRLNNPTYLSRKFPARRDRFLFFEVGDLTFHQVCEVTGADKRLSINGWFHSSERRLNFPPFTDIISGFRYPIRLEGFILLDDWINPTYRGVDFYEKANTIFSDTSCLILCKFFKSEIYFDCYNSLRSPEITWEKRGPPNIRNYEIADLNTLPNEVTKLADFVRSSVFILFLKNISQLQLLGANGRGDFLPCKCIVEVMRCRAGSYTMITDNAQFMKIPGLDIYFFFTDQPITDETGGFVTYVSIDNSSEKDDEPVTLMPMNNSIYIVYRSTDSGPFLKYINNKFKGTMYCIAATFYEIGVF